MKFLKKTLKAIFSQDIIYFLSRWRKYNFKTAAKTYSLRLDILRGIRKVFWRNYLDSNRLSHTDIEVDEYPLSVLVPEIYTKVTSYIVTAHINKKVVYTAIFGDYDLLKDPDYVNKDWDYICFTDNKKITSNVFTIKLVDPLFENNTKNARMLKVLSHLFLVGFDYSLWIDGSVKLRGRNINELVNDLDNKNAYIGVHKHEERDCIYDEARECILVSRGNKSMIERQIFAYHFEKMPEHFGLVETAELLRNLADERSQKFNIYWWIEIDNNSNRDQLSFSYVCWKYGFDYNVIPGIQYDDDYFKMYEHLK